MGITPEFTKNKYLSENVGNVFDFHLHIPCQSVTNQFPVGWVPPLAVHAVQYMIQYPPPDVARGEGEGP